MKRRWEAQELDEHFTLRDTERDLLANKTGATRLDFAVLLKYFQMEVQGNRGLMMPLFNPTRACEPTVAGDPFTLGDAGGTEEL